MDGIGAALAVIGHPAPPMMVLRSLVPLICVLAVLALVAVAVVLAVVLIVRQESRRRPPAGQAGPPEGPA
jgi:hypothetical protein